MLKIVSDIIVMNFNNVYNVKMVTVKMIPGVSAMKSYQ